MKKIVITFLLILLFFILDNTVMPFLAINDYFPSTLFVFIICFSIINGKWEGLWVGVAAGLLQDVYFYNAFGINSLLNMLLCIFAGEIGTNIFKEKILIPMGTTFGMSIIKGLGIFVIMFIIGQHTNIQNALFNGIYEMVVCLIIYKPIYRLYQKDPMKKDWKF